MCHCGYSSIATMCCQMCPYIFVFIISFILSLSISEVDCRRSVGASLLKPVRKAGSRVHVLFFLNGALALNHNE